MYVHESAAYIYATGTLHSKGCLRRAALAGLAALLTRLRNTSSLCAHWSPCLAGCLAPMASTGSGASSGRADEHGEWRLDELWHMLMEHLWCSARMVRHRLNDMGMP